MTLERTHGRRDDSTWRHRGRHAPAGADEVPSPATRSTRSNSRWLESREGRGSPGARGRTGLGSGRCRDSLRLRAGRRGALRRPGPGGARRARRSHRLGCERQDRQDLDRQGGRCRNSAHHRVGPDVVPLHRGLAGHLDVQRRLRQNLAAAPRRQRRARVRAARCEGLLAPEGRQGPLAGGFSQAPALHLRG